MNKIRLLGTIKNSLLIAGDHCNQLFFFCHRQLSPLVFAFLATNGANHPVFNILAKYILFYLPSLSQLQLKRIDLSLTYFFTNTSKTTYLIKSF